MPYFFPHFINIKHFNLVNKQKAPFSTTEQLQQSLHVSRGTDVIQHRR